MAMLSCLPSSILSALIFFVGISTVKSQAFLRPALRTAAAVDNKASILAEITASFRRGRDESRLEHFETVLKPMYTALPKNEHGNLGDAVARYALHRSFVQRHGWSIDGLEPAGDEAERPAGSLENWVPSYLLGKIERLMGTTGINLHELAVLAATFEDLIHREAIKRLEEVYDMLDVPRTESIDEEEAAQVIAAYMTLYSSGGNETVRTRKDLEAKRGGLDKNTKEWLRKVQDVETKSYCDHSTGECRGLDFNATTHVVERISEQYGAFNENLCQDLKFTLLEVEDGRWSGRVALSDFYHVGMHGSWNFNEKEDYLRALGTIDESDPGSSRLIVPNYVYSQPNCLAASSVYEVCCHNKCEDYMSVLEEEIKGPTAEPEQIVNLVGKHFYSKVTPQLRRRLDEVAGKNGQVPLHGRLFAQWMHHLFPHECPQPHEKGSGPQTPDEWMKESGHEGTQASKEEIQKHMEKRAPTQVELPWNGEERLLPIQPPAQPSEGEKEDMISELKAMMQRGMEEGILQEYESDLQPMYAALPKNANGNLDDAVARYALHRSFIQRHGWTIDGLEPTGEESEAPTGSIERWVPAQLLSSIEKLMSTSGINLKELAILAYTFDDLIHQEALKRLREIYELFDLPVGKRIHEKEGAKVVAAYMVMYTSGGNTTVRTAKDLEQHKGGLDQKTQSWLREVQRRVTETESACDAESGKCGELDFRATTRVVETIGQEYGSFNQDLCMDLKSTLLNVEDRKSGRVLLSDFYQVGLHGTWNFTETEEYLKVLGALDDSDPRGPRVIVPNYVYSRPNCLASSSIYEVCCRNECEDLMGYLEQEIGTSSATPEVIAKLVASRASATVRAPRKLPELLLSRLKEAANQNGRVPLHGRLFAQWMHHAYPRECPRPHDRGSMGPQTPDEWMTEAKVGSTRASKEEMMKYVGTNALGEVELPWSSEEYIMPVHSAKPKEGSGSKASLLAQLTASFSRGHDEQRLEAFDSSLRPMYTTLPKNDDGILGHAAARYALHRLFVQKHGWTIDGLEPSGDKLEMPTGSLDKWVPAYLLNSIEQLMGTHGINLRELSVLAATFEDLIHKEATKRMEDVYDMLKLPMTEPIEEEDAAAVTTAYMTLYASGGNETVRSRKDIEENGATIDKRTKAWLRDVRRDVMKKEGLCNDKTGECNGLDFKTVTRIGEQIGERYGSFNQNQCKDLKNTLLSAEDRQTGRVYVSDFYKVGLHGYWDFSETPEYLKSLGALDETDPKGARVIVPNYVYSRPNCLAASSIYEVCCRNECEDLVGQLEKTIGAEHATPERIAKVVAGLSSDTVRAPRNLPSTLLRRLDEVAGTSGRVPLHSRLFAQWMHHAFPRECPLPHAIGGSGPQTPDEWMESRLASEEERRKMVDASGLDDNEIPWSSEEKLLTRNPSSTYADTKAEILAEMSASFRRGHDEDLLQKYETELRQMFGSLPKNSHGNLGHAVARYALHRLFVNRHGWTIDGLEPAGEESASPTGSLENWVPAYLLSNIEKLMGTNGISLHELAVLAATFEDLIHREATKRLEDVYDMMELTQTKLIDGEKAANVIATYMIMYTSGGNSTVRTREDLEKHRGGLDHKTKVWLRDVQQEVSEAESLCDAATGKCGGLDFEAATRVVEQIGERYSAFNAGLCTDLKYTLLDVEDRKSGRVLLSDFYKVGLHGSWNFTEKEDYLKTLGALDESDARGPRVIIPNYVNSRPNCLAASSIYEVCCRNECEDLLGHLEQEIGAPTALPKRVAELITALPSDTVRAPRKLTAPLMSRLDEIAAGNGGRVPLHGRLFAQWMHHAYPRECPRPHEDGAVGPQTPDEWMKESGHASTRASEEEMLKFVGDEQELPWSNEERVLTQRPVRSSQSSVMGNQILWACGGVLALLFAVIARPKEIRGEVAFDGSSPSVATGPACTGLKQRHVASSSDFV